MKYRVQADVTQADIALVVYYYLGSRQSGRSAPPNNSTVWRNRYCHHQRNFERVSKSGRRAKASPRVNGLLPHFEAVGTLPSQ